MVKFLLPVLALLVTTQFVRSQDEISFWNDTLCGTPANDSKPIPYLFNLDPDIEEVVPELAYGTEVEVNLYNTVTKEGKTFHGSELHNFKVVTTKKADGNGVDSPSFDPVLLSSQMNIRFPSQNKDQERIINFRTQDPQGNFHSETFVLSWNKRSGEKEFQPCQTYTDKESAGTGGNNLPLDLWPTDDVIPKPMLFASDNTAGEPYTWFIGTSAVLHQARLMAERGLVKYNGQERLTEPAILADVWTYCVDVPNFAQYSVKFYFSTGKAIGPDGTLISVPPRPLKVVTTKNGGEEFQTITFHNFLVYPSNVPIGVPLQMGCTRLNEVEPGTPTTKADGTPVNVPIPDDFFKTDFEIEMEIVTRSGDDSFTSSSSSNAKFYHLSGFNMTSITKTEMDIMGQENATIGGVDAVRYKSRSVVDLNDMFMYQIKLSTSECSITQPMDIFNKTNLWDMVPPMSFMMGAKLKLFNRELWTVDSKLTFMGRRLERGIPCLVYEKNFENIFSDELGQSMVATVTQYFVDASKGVRYENPFAVNGAPLKLVITIWDGAKETINREITVNVYKFKSGVIDEDTRTREFGITDCFDEDYQSDWFQIVFAVDTAGLVNTAIAGKSGEIKESLRDALDVAPNRLPVMDVDYNEAGLITVSAQLLDRPEWYYLFSVPVSGQIKSGALTQSFLIETPSACARKCLASDECTDFSYCNNMECDLFLGGKTHGAKLEIAGTSSNNNEMNDCVSYSRSATDKKQMNFQILDQLQITIDRKNFKIPISYTNESGFQYDKDVTAIELKREVAPGFGDWKGILPKVGKDDEADTNHWINDYQIWSKGRKFAFEKPEMKYISGLGISGCADLCNEDERCNSFSFCNRDKILECIVTMKHGSEITEGSTAKDPSCNILSKNFLTEYERHPKMKIVESAAYAQLVSSELECAKLCSTNKSLECESFDFCDNIEDVSETGSFTCLTHKYHLATTSDADRDTLQIKLDLNTTICEHFTKKYTKDYTATRDKKLKNVPVTESIESLPLESCASTCSQNSGSCQSFEYCERLNPNSGTEEVTTNTRSKPSRTCKMVSEKLTNLQERTESDENCIVYVVTKTTERRRRVKKGSDSDSGGGVSPVAVGLVSVLFLVLSAVGSAYGFRWYRNRGTAV